MKAATERVRHGFGVRIRRIVTGTHFEADARTKYRLRIDRVRRARARAQGCAATVRSSSRQLPGTLSVRSDGRLGAKPLPPHAARFEVVRGAFTQ